MRFLSAWPCDMITFAYLLHVKMWMKRRMTRRGSDFVSASMQSFLFFVVELLAGQELFLQSLKLQLQLQHSALHRPSLLAFRREQHVRLLLPQGRA